MQRWPSRIVARLPGGDAEVDVTGPGSYAAGPLVVELAELDTGFTWAVANAGDGPVLVDAVTVVLELDIPTGDVRMLRHGYQSWAPTSVAILGKDDDPSLAEGALGLTRAMYHADPGRAAPGELRSELVTVVTDDAGPFTCWGFLGGSEHDGTFRLRPRWPQGPELRIEAWLGAVLQPGERRRLHAVRAEQGDDPSALLEAWAARFGEAGRARAGEPYQVGWCSWYHYFHDVTETAFRHNLGAAGDWPFEVFQLDDGFQHAIGDWLETNQHFPSPLDRLAADVAAAGFRPGLWLAPFFVSPGSRTAGRHLDWIARFRDPERMLVGMVNPGWGGVTHVLDTTMPEVLDHLETTARAAVDAGWTYLKLDFLYGAALPGTFRDPGRTPAQRVRAGLEAIRRGAGDRAFLLGCGCPLGPAVGVVDGMRIGPDVAPWWDPPNDQWTPPGYGDAAPATRNAWRNTLTRSFQHRRLWLNDPDCVMLRTTETRLSPDAARAWAYAVGVSGGMALVSDDLALLDGDARRLLDEVVEIGRESDAAARTGPPARCADLMDDALPLHLSSGPHDLAGHAGRQDS